MAGGKDQEPGVIFSPQHGEDVTRAGGVFAPVDASAELTQRLQDVDVVAAHEVLGQVDDGHHQRLLRADTRHQPSTRS